MVGYQSGSDREAEGCGLDKAAVMLQLAGEVRSCHACPGLNVPSETEAAPGYGSPRSPVVIVGQSLCGPCMASQVPFTGGSGRLLDEAFAAAGVAKEDVFITNVVHCHPPGNRASLPSEIANCRHFLEREIEIVAPRLVIALGRDARDVVVPMCRVRPAHEAPAVLAVHHPAYVRRQPLPVRTEYVNALAGAIRWAFDGLHRCQVRETF